jgi:two-component system chemotaxis response regulator CheY
MIDTNDGLIEGYVTECGEHLAVMEEIVLALELGGAKVDGELAKRLSRAARSIKSGAELCGLASIAGLARRTERALAPISLGLLAPTPPQVTVLLRAIDALRALLKDPDASGEADVPAVMEALASLSSGGRSQPRRAADWRLRTLLVEDDFTSRLVLQTFLSRYGDCHIAVNGMEAVSAFRAAIENGHKYHLICMDIMMPEMDGGEAVRQIRQMEEGRGVVSTDGVKIVMTTAVSDLKEVMRCFHDLCDAYLVKPIDLGQLLANMKRYDLV